MTYRIEEYIKKVFFLGSINNLNIKKTEKQNNNK